MKPVAVSGQLDGLILYDGECAFCSRWVRWLIARDCEHRYRFAVISGETGRQVAMAIGLNPDDPSSSAVIVNGVALFKSDAALAVLSSLPGWAWTGAAARVPRPIRDWAYDQIAANRYRVFGKLQLCEPPSPEDRERFLQ